MRYGNASGALRPFHRCSSNGNLLSDHLGRVNQQTATGTDYFLADALGSVGQLTDPSGAITLIKSYTPFGEVLSTEGSGITSYGFTGECKDSYITDGLAGQGLIYLRSRYYTPTVGRFLTRDTWDGNIEQPMSLNKWLYVEGNPINRTDPSGKCYVQITGTSVVWFPDSSPLCQLQAQAQSMARAYNRNKAVETALAWFRKDPYYSNNCANFVSAVLAEAGIYDSLGNWKPGSSWWIRSGDGNREDLFHFLTKYFRFAEYNQGDYGRFRPRLDEGFQSWLRGLQGRLRKGDVVFYKEVGIDPQKTIPAVWTHAAIVVDPYAPETSMYMKVTGPGLLKPRIVEHSGALNIYCRHNGQSPYCRSESSLDTGRSSETLDAGRSIDDTKRQMHAIAIVFMGEPLGVLP